VGVAAPDGQATVKVSCREVALGQRGRPERAALERSVLLRLPRRGGGSGSGAKLASGFAPS